MLALGVCFPQPCSSAGRRLPRQDHVYILQNKMFVYTIYIYIYIYIFDEMPCKLDSTKHAPSFTPNPTLPHSPFPRRRASKCSSECKSNILVNCNKPKSGFHVYLDLIHTHTHTQIWIWCEDELRSARRNANRNPEWWGHFSQLQ